MPKNRHWIIFADDTGDPGPSGTEHFGYATLAVERLNVATLTQLVSEFRVKHSVYSEAKVKVDHPLFRYVIDRLASVCEKPQVMAGACILRKSHYEGPYLRAVAGVPNDPHFLRNYVIRHALEGLFDDVMFESEDTIEVVLDRVDYNEDQVYNLRDYLNSTYANEGRFDFPQPRFVTHADSSYVEGLQLANHLAELSNRVYTTNDVDVLRLAARFLRIKTLFRSREVKIDDRARDGMGRKAKARVKKGETGAGDHIPDHPPP